MWSLTYKTLAFLTAGFFCFADAASTSQHKQQKTVWNYDGGVFFETDGSLPNGVCFKVTGRMSSSDFFDNLKRIDTEQGAIFHRGAETVTQFPESVTVTYSIRDQLCPSGIQQIGTRRYMTQEMMDNLHLSIYWKHGVELRAVKNSKLLKARVDRINPYAASLAAELPRRYEWSYELEVSSAGVPLSDGLSFIFRTPEGRIAARVAARL